MRTKKLNKITTKGNTAIIHIHSTVYGHKKALIDKKDIPLVKNYTWCVKEHRGHFYVQTTILKPKRKNITLHRLLMGFPKDMIDHANRNSLDNRRSNLRTCTNIQNLQNRPGKKNSSSQFKGVHWVKRDSVWAVNLKVNKTNFYLGQFVDEVKAAIVYDRWASIFHKDFAYFNFPELQGIII